VYQRNAWILADQLPVQTLLVVVLSTIGRSATVLLELKETHLFHAWLWDVFLIMTVAKMKDVIRYLVNVREFVHRLLVLLEHIVKADITNQFASAQLEQEEILMSDVLKIPRNHQNHLNVNVKKTPIVLAC
jgi:hypothetical protein